MVGGFWDSWRGRQIRWRRRWLRTRLLQIDGEPDQKGRRGLKGRMVAAQHGLIDQLEARRWRALTGPVALDVDFYTGARQPPALHRLAKHLLDPLGPARPDVAKRQRHVLYRDDRQVKLLYVHLWQGAADSRQSAHTAISARPLRDVVEDMDLMYEIRSEGFSFHSFFDDDDSPFYAPDVPNVDLRPTFDLDLTASMEQASEWEDLNEWLIDHDVSRVQDALLLATDARLTRIICAAPNWMEGAGREATPGIDLTSFKSIYEARDELQSEYRRMLLSEPLAYPLPGLPSGEGEEFRASVLGQLDELLRKRPVFNPLLVPLKAIFLVVPPTQGKDLDNIALTLLPLVHEVLQPRLEPWFKWEKRSFRIIDRETGKPSSGPHSGKQNSVAAYEIIEIKPAVDDPPGGYLCLALVSGDQIGSTWGRIADVVDKYMYDLEPD
jgi:hypothetical protein